MAGKSMTGDVQSLKKPFGLQTGVASAHIVSILEGIYAKMLGKSQHV